MPILARSFAADHRARRRDSTSGRNRAPDPDRDAGVYRYLFEPAPRSARLYRRHADLDGLVLEMHGIEGSRTSALASLSELSDEQYAVPSHPFTMSSRREVWWQARLP